MDRPRPPTVTATYREATLRAEQLAQQPHDMANRGYDVVVDVDQEGDLGHTDLQQDNLEFHSSSFTNNSSLPPPASAKPANGSSFDPTNSTTGSSKRFLWSISFYAQFFDVDTNEVLRRCLAAVFPRANFLDVLDGNPDLYGPFWIATTVIVILFLSGSISRWLKSTGAEAYAYDFRLLSGAAGLIYGYTGVIPLALWAALKWSGSEAANVLECWSLYGYANVIWIPVAIISWSPLDILNWVFVGVGLAVSALFLVRNLLPVINTTPKKRAKALLILVVILHLGLAVTIKFLFFAHQSPIAKKPAVGEPPVGAPVDGAPGDGAMPPPEDGHDSDTDGEGEGGAGDEGVRMLRLLLRSATGWRI